MNKNAYEAPSIETSIIASQDIVRTSGTENNLRVEDTLVTLD